MAAQSLITEYENWESSTIEYGAPKINARGGKSIKIVDTKKQQLVINTPLILTWGVNKIEDETSGKTSYNMSIQYPSENYGTDSTRLFFEKMKDFEAQLKRDAKNHSMEWFGKSSISEDMIDMMFSPMVKYPNIKGTNEPDFTRAPTTRIKIPYWNDTFNVELFDMNQQYIYDPLNENTDVAFETLIPKTSHVAAVIQCNGIWFVGGKFGVTWQLLQCMVRKPVRIQGRCFVKLNNDDKQELKHISQRETENNESIDLEVEDSDIDDVPVESKSENNYDNIDKIEQDVKEELNKPVVVKKKKRVIRKSAT